MYKFMLTTTFFLAWGFYELSGGADFQPATQSADATESSQRVRMSALERAIAVDSGRSVPPLSDADTAPQVARAQSDIDLPIARITRASMDAGDATELVPAAADMSNPRTNASVNIDTGAPSAKQDRMVSDIRAVTGNRVNLRSGPGTSHAVVDTLIQGAKVEILEDTGSGWLKLRVQDGAETGYVADWLVGSTAG